MTARVVVLGAGFGGLEVASGLSEVLGGQIQVTLIDRRADFVFGFAKLDVMFGTRTAAEVRHPYARIDKPGVRFVQAEITGIDAARRHVQTSAGDFAADYLVIALGADLDEAATPGLAGAGHDFYSVDGAFAVRETLADFTGGRVVIGVLTPDFKCPPAPSETALLADEYLRARGLREASEVSLVMPWPSPVPPVPAASEVFLAEFDKRGILWHPGHVIDHLDPHEVIFSDGHRLGYDLFLAVPKHVLPPVIAASGLAAQGWVPVDHDTFRTRHDGVYAIGDVAASGTPKAGTFATGQAKVVTAQILADLGAASTIAYDGNGICLIGFGGGEVAQVGGVFRDGNVVTPLFDPASRENAAAKEQFRRTTAARWFGV
jgi:sulfide:quinone oxidoreductase